jgi:hypothetical protein
MFWGLDGYQILLRQLNYICTVRQTAHLVEVKGGRAFPQSSQVKLHVRIYPFYFH